MARAKGCGAHRCVMRALCALLSFELTVRPEANNEATEEYSLD